MMRQLLCRLLSVILLAVLWSGGLAQAQDDMPILVYGQTVDGELNAEQVSLFYGFDAQANDVITITMIVTGGDLDPFIVLNDSSRRPLTTDDNSGGGVNARLTYVIPSSGRYIIQATSAGGGIVAGNGTFSLNLTAALENSPPPAQLPTETPAPAATEAPTEEATVQGDSVRLVAIEPGATIRNLLDRQTAVRYYWFQGQEGDQLSVTPEPGASFEPLMVLYDGGFVELERSTTGLSAALPQTGVYFLALALPESGSAGGGYGFTFNLSPNLATQGNFTEIAYGQSVQGTIDNAAYGTTYRFFGSAGDAVTISLSRVGGDLDGYLYLFDEAGQLLFEDNDSGGENGNARITYTLPADGAYLIMATRMGQAQGATSGSYLLELASDAAPPAPTMTAEPTLPAEYADFPIIAYDQPVEGELTNAKYMDVYVFFGAAGDSVTIEMNSGNSDAANGLDPLLVLLDDGRIPLVENDDIVDGEIRDARIEFTLPKSGYYAIVATRFDQQSGTSEGPYTLAISTSSGAADEAGAEASVPADASPLARLKLTPLEPGTPVQAVFEAGAALYTFAAAAGAVVDLSVTADSGLESLLILADENLNEVLSSSSGALEAVSIPDDGNYLVLVAPRFGPLEAPGGGYILALTEIGEGQVSAEVTDGPSPISYGQTVNGVIDDETVSRLYTFSGKAGDHVRITMEAAAGSSLDCYLELQDSEGNVIAANDDIDPGVVRDSRLTAELAADGTYQILASRYVGEDAEITSGAYTLTLEVVAPGAAGVSTGIIPLAYGQSESGEINDDQYLLFYVFEGTVGDVINIEIEHLSGNLDSVLYLYQSSSAGWVEMAKNDDSPTGGTFEAALRSVVLPITGKYLIAVGRYDLETGTTSGTFTITLTRQ